MERELEGDEDMKKPELEFLLRMFCRALALSLRRIRRDGVCVMCGAIPGERHRATCFVWPLILIRSVYWRRGDVA
jgi:hypothetical protein